MLKNEIPKQMAAVLLTGHGGHDKLDYRTDVSVAQPKDDEVLIKVAASGINNTDINTRIGWYSKEVTGATNNGASQGFSEVNDDDASWSGVPLAFPRIQGADCCGYIAAVGKNVDESRIGERVIVRTMQRSRVDNRGFKCWTFGSECDGAFAQYSIAFADEAFTVNCDWSDAQLASIPCAYSTAENLLHRAGIKAGERVLVTGASGGVGSAAVQLAKRRGAIVIAQVSATKAEQVIALGADQCVARDANLVDVLTKESVDVVVDLVAGDAWPQLLEVLKVGGRYATAGAIGGPLVALDIRTLYLKDLSFFGCTFQDDIVFENLISYIEAGEIRPVVAQTFPLSEIARAQQKFEEKSFTGKLVLLPPQ